MVNFPTSIDAFNNPTNTDNLDTTGVVHHVQHSDANDAIEALETKVGVDNSAVTTTLDYKVANRLNLDQTTPQTITGRQIQQDGLQLGLTPTVGTTSQGKLFWDAVNKCPAVDMGNGIVQQVGEEVYVPLVKNTTVSQINNGQIVYINGHDGTNPTIALAKADSITTSYALGVATENIAAGSLGRITKIGLVHDLDTHTFTAGQPLFLSYATAGLFTVTPPVSPNIAIQIGTVGKVDATDGDVLVNIGVPQLTDVEMNNATNAASSSSLATKTYIDQRWIDVNRYGFVPGETTLTFNGTNTITVTPVGADWHYYRAGLKHHIGTAKSITITGTPIATAKYYIYIDATDGTLSQSTVEWTLNDTKVTVATLYFNDTLTPKFEFADERHTCLIDRRAHMAGHYTIGTLFSSGGTLTGYTPNTPTDAGNTFGIATSNIFDQDLYKTLAALVDTNGTTANYKLVYRTAASTWAWQEKDMPFYYTGATAPYTFVHYDLNGTMTQGIANRYYNYYIYMTNVVAASEATQGTSTQSGRYMFVAGRAAFTSQTLADGESPSTFTFAGFPVEEAVAVWRITLYTGGGGGESNTVKGRCAINKVAQVAANIISSSTSVSASHDGLLGVNLAQAGVTYGHIDDQTQTIAGAKTFTSDVIVPDEAYGVDWNGVLEVPTKNAIYDEVELRTPTSRNLTINGVTYNLSADRTWTIATGGAYNPALAQVMF